MMVKLSYKLEGQSEEILGQFRINKEGKLEITIEASTPEDLKKKFEDLGALNNCSIYLDGEQVNYQNLYSKLFKKE